MQGVFQFEDKHYVTRQRKDFSQYCRYEKARFYVAGACHGQQRGTAVHFGDSGISLAARSSRPERRRVFDGIVFELSSGETETEQTELMLAFDEPQQLKVFCSALPCHITEKLRFCQLYKLQGRYFLLCGLDRSQSWAMSQSALNSAVFDEVKLQKIREYGEFLSRTPIETIRKLTDP